MTQGTTQGRLRSLQEKLDKSFSYQILKLNAEIKVALTTQLKKGE